MMRLLKVSLLIAYVVAEREHATDIEIQQVEVFEVPWQEGPSEQQPPQQGYGPPKQEYGPPPQEYGPPKQDYGPPQQGNAKPQQEYGPPQQEYGPPQQENAKPQQEYGPPKQEYGPPPVYGPPHEEATTTESAVTTTELPTTTEYPYNATNRRFERLQKEDDLTQGVYYIYHPEGLLQRVVYSTRDDVKRMEYSARLKYENVQPIRGPIYTYDPRNLKFQRIRK